MNVDLLRTKGLHQVREAKCIEQSGRGYLEREKDSTSQPRLATPNSSNTNGARDGRLVERDGIEHDIRRLRSCIVRGISVSYGGRRRRRRRGGVRTKNISPLEPEITLIVSELAPAVSVPDAACGNSVHQVSRRDA